MLILRLTKNRGIRKMKKSYKHLTLEQRYSIEKLLNKRFSIKKISSILNVSKSTVYREISRNKYYKGNYIHSLAHTKYRKRLKNKGIIPKLESDIILRDTVISSLANCKWSPEEISGRLKLESNIDISFNSIYRYIAKDRKKGGKLYCDLRHPNKNKYNIRRSKKVINKLQGKKSIEQRPNILDNSKSNWEGDLVEVSKKEYIVTLTEKESKLLITDKVKSKNAEEVAESIIDTLFELKDKVSTITFDNGTEFSLFRRIEEDLKTRVYFAHPYSSWERGLNEHTNGLIRQFVPKRGKYKAKHVSYKELETIQNLINNRPRKILNYKTPNEVFYGINNIKCCT